MKTQPILVATLLIFCQIAVGQQYNLLTATKSGDLNAVRAHVESSGEVNHIIESEGTLLQVALISKHSELARYLIDAGADTNLTSEANDQPPLTLAIRLDDLEILKYLIKNGADINGEDSVGRTPLFKTLKPDRPAARTLLIKSGVDINKPLNNGVTVFVEAMGDVNIGAINELIANNAAVDAKLVDEIACASCHSAKAVAEYAHHPHLGGQNAEYIEKQLRDYHNKTRNFNRMDRVSGVFVEEINGVLAAYYESQPRYKNKPTGTPGLLAKGKQIYDNDCASCHGVDGITTQNKLIPTLAGLTSSYLSNQLSAYKEGERDNDADSVMRNIMANLTRDQIFEVTSYIQSMH